MAPPKVGPSGQPPPAGEGEGSTGDGGSAAAGRWKDAGRAVVNSVRLSQRLLSLRDQLGGSAFVDWKELKHMKPLGSGAFANVSQVSFSAPSGLTQIVAKKQIRTELLQDPQEVQIFVDEVKLLRKLKHKYIVGIVGCGWSEETEVLEAGDNPPSSQQLFYLQEFMPGGSLQHLVLKAMTSQMGRKVYTDEDALRWALQMALALEYLHTRIPKVIHRDLKLENVLLTSPKPAQADAKLADFGLARLLRSASRVGKTKAEKLQRIASKASGELDASASAKAEELGEKLTKWMSRKLSVDDEAAVERELTAQTGSMGYMAPEVLQGLPYSEKADVFSYGLILYNLFSRNIPTVHIVLNGTFEDLEVYAHNVAHGFRPAMGPQIPAPIRALIERCWKGLPELRPSMSEVVRELEKLQPPPAVAEPVMSGGASVENDLPDGGGGDKSCCCSLM